MSTPASSPGELERALSLLTRRGFTPTVGLVLGSGLGPLADEVDAVAKLHFEDIPGFTKSTAPGHSGELVLGTLAGQSVVALKGRVHYYEGVSAQAIVFPVRVMAALGVHTLVVSNACGGLEPTWSAGDIMLQTDFINFTGDNPLIGPNDDASGPRFPVMFGAYDAELQALARRVARRRDILLREGVYLAVSGPSYATRAELRMFRLLGADAIGMSTVFEVIAARHLGLRVLGLSSVTDMAIADRDEHATGDEVLASAARSGPVFRELVKTVLAEL